MKKIISIFAIFTLFLMLVFTGNTYAATLDAIHIETSETIVRPGKEVKVSIQFGQELGAYTFHVAYDNNIFEYVKSEGGTASSTSDRVLVTFYDETGGSNPRSDMSITFKAKEDITTSNPTEFTITADGLANPDASIVFDDITTPIVKNVTVEPEYVDYTLDLKHTGDLIKEKENEMTVSYSSSMGRYYEHARLVAEVKTPAGATAKLLATDEQNLEHDIIESGWGDAQGYKIGGKDVSQVLQVRGIFSEIGDYTVTLKLIDRDNSDQVIAQKDFQLTVVETVTPPSSETTPEEEPPAQTTPENEVVEEITTEQTPTELPKTGTNIYIPIIVVLIGLICVYVFYNKKSTNKIVK